MQNIFRSVLLILVLLAPPSFSTRRFTNEPCDVLFDRLIEATEHSPHLQQLFGQVHGEEGKQILARLEGAALSVNGVTENPKFPWRQHDAQLQLFTRRGTERIREIIRSIFLSAHQGQVSGTTFLTKMGNTVPISILIGSLGAIAHYKYDLDPNWQWLTGGLLVLWNAVAVRESWLEAEKVVTDRTVPRKEDIFIYPADEPGGRIWKRHRIGRQRIEILLSVDDGEPVLDIIKWRQSEP